MSAEYDEYLRKHKTSVISAYEFILDNIPDLIPFEEKLEIEQCIYTHDSSKYSFEEYDAYDNHFYIHDPNTSPEEEQLNFAYARNHHYHNNPHHWTHWLVFEEDRVYSLPMPYKYILEMICDWWSFGWMNGNLNELFSWYESNKEKVILHPETREIVIAILDEIKCLLEQE